MVADECFPLDKTLYPTKVGVAFHQYNKNKPAKHGLLFQSINSAEMPHTYNSILYSGKLPGELNEYYITTADDLVKYLVTSLTNQVNMPSCNISSDWFCTSLELANWLLEGRMAIVGTIKTNLLGVGDLKKMDDRENNSTLIGRKTRAPWQWHPSPWTRSFLVSKTCLYWQQLTPS